MQITKKEFGEIARTVQVYYIYAVCDFILNVLKHLNLPGTSMTRQVNKCTKCRSVGLLFTYTLKIATYLKKQF